MTYLYNHSDVEIRPYAAPEIFFSNKQTDAKNIYSLGLIMYQLVFHQLPFSLRQNGDVIAFLQKMKTTKLCIPKNKFQKLQLIQLIIKQIQRNLIVSDIISQMIVYNHQERINREKLGEMIFQNFKRGSRRIASIQPIAAKADDYLYF